MEAQIVWRVMADMFDEGSLVLASLVVLNTVRHSGMSKHELRLHGAQSWACCQLTATDKGWMWKEKNILSGMIVTNP